jgi:putative transposase
VFYKVKKTYTSDFKARMVIEALRGEKTINEIASKNGIHPVILTRWKTEAINDLPLLFDNTKSNKKIKEYEDKIEELYKQIGKLTTQNEWMKKKSGREL